VGTRKVNEIFGAPFDLSWHFPFGVLAEETMEGETVDAKSDIGHRDNHPPSTGKITPCI